MSETLLLVLVLLACPVGMCLMMWLMMRYQRQNQSQSQKPAGDRADYGAQEAEAVRLQAEIDQLKAAQRDAAAQRKPVPPDRHLPPGEPPGK